MDKSFAFNEITIKRMPQFFVLIIFLLLGLPYLGVSLGMDFGFSNTASDHINSLHNFLIESEVRAYFKQTLLQWSGFSLAAVTLLLAFTRYRLTNDIIALIIGLSVLFSGSIEATHALFTDGLSLHYREKNNFDALVWIYSNSMAGLILLIGLSLLLNRKKEYHLSLNKLVYLSLLIVFIASASIYYFSALSRYPDMWFQSFISRPYELISSFIYATIVITLYPRVYKAHPTILSHCLLYMSLTQIAITLYLMFLSHSPYDSGYYIAYYLKLLSYFIPCICLIIDYISSYSNVVNAQKKIKIKQEELEYIASHDSLTNLFNRREFEDLLDKTISNALRNKTSLALLLIDLDNFKATNDTFGHIHGDELLKQFSNRLVLLIRKGDLISRVGGDEFTLISPNIKSPSSARQLAERILNELNSPYLINGKLITVTVSIGISIFPNDGRNSEKLLIKADLAMYKAKSSGKNTYQFYTEQLSYLQHRESEIEAHLRKALQNNEFRLSYQPKYNLITNEIVGAEILLRWDNAVLGSISPNEFIPVAERSGLIIEIGNWVLVNSCKQIVAWMNEYNTDLSFSINISPIQLANTQFLNNLKKILADADYSAQNLELEITENILMGDSNEISNVLNDIAALGIKFSLDDFGKGYSSLNRLKMLPIDTLKIDKYFISDIQDEHEKVVIVDIIIKLANELGMDIIAEGIETKAQLNYLIAKKCILGQGFLLSEPLSTEDFIELAFKNKEAPDARSQKE